VYSRPCPIIVRIILVCFYARHLKSNQIRFISGNIWPIKTTKKTTKRQTDIRTYNI